MQIILKKDVENLGLEFDTIDVKPGYARNFLLPQGYALLATPKNRATLAETLESRKEEEAKLVADANKIVEQLKKTTMVIETKVGSGDKLFGSINNGNLSDELSKKGVSIDKKYIKIPGSTIKRTGKYTAKVRLHREVEYDYDFEVISDAPPVVALQKAPVAKKVEVSDETTSEQS
ncbi:50S ribosomal protein L9 [Halpernia frigidisoli]|uniref:Large ribosomal subunit protein bL9 n=1 Tax=Halpernia frigidisoli TaxID=1125876 RepID=A0A1I3E8H7_9FLAO|nr:50S ribosomal protein L9 [Halpernia frigidisoli]SFH95255.1 large subunit ribosomal protein L9 [Halpernia frigidisoli]